MAGELLFRLRRLQLAVEQASRPTLDRKGLTSAQALILAWLLEQPQEEVYACQVHRQTGLSRAAISTTLKNLQRDGYLEALACPGDDRKKRIVLTRKARDLAPDLAAGMERQQAWLCAGLTRRQLQEFERCLRRMEQNLRQGERPPACAAAPRPGAQPTE